MSDKPIIDDLDFEELPNVDVPPIPDTKRNSRNGRKAPQSRQSKPAPPYRQGVLVEPLTRLYATMAVGLMPFAPRAAQMTMVQAEEIAHGWDEWAKTSPAVRRLLYPIINVGASATVLAAHLPIAIAAFIEVKPNSPLVEMAEEYLTQYIASKVKAQSADERLNEKANGSQS